MSEEPTQINEQGLRMAILADLQERIHDAVCAGLTPRFFSAMAVLIILGVIQSVIIITWVSDGMASLRTDISTQGATVDSSGKQISALDANAVRQSEIVALREEMRELKNANRWLNLSVDDLKEQQKQLSTAVSTVSALTLSVQSKVGEEQAARRELIEAIGGLREELRER